MWSCDHFVAESLCSHTDKFSARSLCCARIREKYCAILGCDEKLLAQWQKQQAKYGAGLKERQKEAVAAECDGCEDC